MGSPFCLFGPDSTENSRNDANAINNVDLPLALAPYTIAVFRRLYFFAKKYFAQTNLCLLTLKEKKFVFL